MTTEEMGELDEWCGKTFDLPFAVDNWVLSTDGGKSSWASWFKSEREALEFLERDLGTVPEHCFKNSKVYHWQFYQKATTDPAAAMMVLKRCGERIVVTCAGPREGDNLWYVCQDFRGDNESGESAPTLELAIAKFARQLFS